MEKNLNAHAILKRNLIKRNLLKARGIHSELWNDELPLEMAYLRRYSRGIKALKEELEHLDRFIQTFDNPFKFV